MTSGRLSRKLLAYALPMILGNILQLTYNAADAVVISKLLGDTALAAVSSSAPVVTVLTLGASGMGIGVSVVISRLFGAGEHEKIKREFSTALLFGLLFSAAVFALGYALAGTILRRMNTPVQAMPEALSYLRVVMLGFLFTFPYNILASAMRGLGDSKTPVVFLSLSCVLNLALDLLFVAVFRLGVFGAAAATALSQAVCAVSCFLYIRRRRPELRLTRRELCMDRTLLRETLRLGSVSALQQAAQPVGKLFIQGVINLQGVTAIDAFSAACHIDDFARIPTQSISNAIMTGAAQNVGAKNSDRVHESFRRGLVLSLLYFPIIFAVVQLTKTPAVRLLSPRGAEDIVSAGVGYLAVKAFFFVMPCLTNSIQGFFRGIGKMRLVLAGTVLQTGVRTLCVFWWVPKLGIVGEAYACLVGWLCQCLLQYGLYFLKYKSYRAD